MRFLRYLNPILTIAIVGTLVWLSSCSSDNDDPDPDPIVTQDELVYINEIFAAGDDWIELYNANDAVKDISGYRIYDDVTNKYALPAGTTIAAKGYLILNCDDLATGLSTNFKLTSDGETVYLENTEGELIDKVEFSKLDNGQTYGRFPDGSVNLKVSGNVTKAAANGESNAPAIDNVVRTPIVPDKSSEVTFVATLVSNTGITSVKLFYKINDGSYTEMPMTLTSGKYSATIPAANVLGRVDYYVEAKNGAELSGFKPFDAPTDSYFYLLNEDALPNLKINEFMAFNSACCPDNDSGTPEYDDWIEIYNAGATAVNVGGMYMSDDPDNPFKDKIPTTDPSSTTIQPGEFLRLWADGSTSQGILHLNFSLSNAGDAVGLYYIDGRTIDEYIFGTQAENVSRGLTTDGGATWGDFATPTPGESNE